MGSPCLYDMKKQASIFFKDKFRTVRLAFTNATPAQLMTEEAINGNPWPPDTRSMGAIAQAAFEIDDYWRIVDILHNRLQKFDRKEWGVSYRAMILLEHLLTHGPKSFAEEFQCDKHVIMEMAAFHYIDDKQFNWGLRVRTLSERVLKLIEDPIFLGDERNRTRKLTRGIVGFGNFGTTQRSFSLDSSIKKDSDFVKRNSRCHSHCNDERQSDKFLGSLETDYKDMIKRERDDRICDYNEDHPFCDNKDQISASLLSSQD